MADLGQILGDLGEIGIGWSREQALLQQQQRQRQQQQALAMLWPALLQQQQRQQTQVQPQPSYAPGQAQPLPPTGPAGGAAAQLPQVPGGGMGPAPSAPPAPSYASVPNDLYGPSGRGMASGLPDLRQYQDTVLRIEGDRDNAIGAAGERGPGQIMPSTGARYGYSPDQLMGDSGRAASRRIYADLYEKSGGDPGAAYVGYNRGERNMARYQAAGDSLAAVSPPVTPAYRAAIQRLQPGVIRTGMQLMRQGAPPSDLQDSSRTALDSGAAIDPAKWGHLERQSIIDAIEETSPKADPIVKSLAFIQMSQLLRPEERLMAQMTMMQNRQQFSLELQQRNQQFREDQQQRQQQFQEQMRQQRELSRTGGAVGDRYAQSKQLEITDKAGNLRTVMAREGKGSVGWVDSFTGQPITIQPGESVKEVTAGVSGGGRAGAQVARQLVGGAEVRADLQNIQSLPVGTTIGPLGMVQPGVTISGALKADLARTLSKEDEINMQKAMSGLGRELSTLMSPVYSGNWASEQLAPLMPRAGETVGNMFYGIARIRQSAVNALEAASKGPILSGEQKEYARQLIKDIDAAIPYSVSDVIAFQQRGNPRESFGDYARRQGIGMQPGDVEGGYRFKGGDPADEKNWEPVQ